MDINAFAKKIAVDKQFRNEEYHKFINNCYILNDVNGNIQASVLTEIIYVAKRNRRVRSLLSGILWFTNKDSISDENFQLLLTFSEKVRSRLLLPVSHLNLSFSQLQIINRLSGDYEAFAQLFDIICKNDCFDDVDMLHLLRETKDGDITATGILYCVDAAIMKYGENIKTVEAVKWAKHTAR